MKELRDLIARNRAGSGEAMPSVCSAHPDVIAASVLLAREMRVPLLIEATSNQVNQFGGYTGMRPADFIRFVRAICADVGAPEQLVLFGGDHLGPQVWRSQPADVAMGHARDLVAAYVRAGFTKIHLDCSEGCAGEPPQVSDEVSAARAAELAGICEAAAEDPSTLSYIYGTEVPPPGGARAEEGGQGIAPTKPESARATIDAHRRHFEALGLGDAWQRAIGLVVQPGLEFAPDHVHRFDPAMPDDLSPVLQDIPGLSFEAHSTDYQAPAVYPELGRRHFAVLKVGPALTHAYRQAIYALDALSPWMDATATGSEVSDLMEGLMRADPSNWSKHYSGSDAQLRLLRHFSYADRIRYYWNEPAAAEQVGRLMARLGETRPPVMVLEQFFAPATLARAGRLETVVPDWRKTLVYAQIQEVLAPYYASPAGSTR
ncbi:class II D-tagatose-bisphosphate aldolase, non-catalytic subunit [Shinella kummerowiae]|uniref:class II D-tagatose-bisphosphate aldolase, non-catalytic subunit n=1 Tax=Shinella kummerowiae TaxID=417745 RepID=UPI0021B617A1|nr:class II D-tagatose-bisphosphate aldolase, non-catalytic subunit [Shinella kummerowiae]MCT7664247.1 class II D-tagatose-bisphosphate aldolase, non-catalytic subunit [Shinella kummerowiae]